MDITIVVLASPDETTIRLDHVGDHIVNKSMFIPDTGLGVFFLVILFVDFLEDILESTVISLQDSVLGGHVEG